MKKFALSLFALLFPALAVASSGSSISFTPPPSDYSVVFLGNIFGIVDGVLHGTGSQILGNIFGVFNSAVLALGGIVIIYILIVSTMNTAGEGEVLGKQWSAIWIPLRSTLGIGLLIPKASGYCLMQIFFMWVIVQGVGAADKVWAAALSYLNRGGVIVQTQMSPITSLTAAGNSVASGASTILAGQVCMLGIQRLLEEQLKTYQAAKENGSGPCSGTPSAEMQIFCNSTVPSFLNSVNATQFQSAQTAAPKTYNLPMPNFDSTNYPDYNFLNGICGTISWAPFSQDSLNTVKQNITSITPNELEIASMSRAIGIQQMYSDLSTVAQMMVSNDPTTKTSNTDNTVKNFSPLAINQFGVPFMDSGVPCTAVSTKCVTWGNDPSSQNAALFSGTEFLGAVADYNGIMLPTINLVNSAKSSDAANKNRDFIQRANSEGWITAGSYFFYLARLNSSTTSSADQTDSNTGLDASSFDNSSPLAPFADGNCVGTYANLCTWLSGDGASVSRAETSVEQVMGLIDGSTILDSPIKVSVSPTGHNAVSGAGSSTVYGFINNSVMVNLPGQPGLTPPNFTMNINIDLKFGQYHLKRQKFPCGLVRILFFFFCLGSLMGEIIYNLIIKNLFNFFLDMITPVVNLMIITFMIAPLMAMAGIFQQNVSIIQQPTINPVIALAYMGANYINFANEFWIMNTMIAVSTILEPMGFFVFGLILFAMPLFLAWIGVMLSIGFITAYYVPFLPYMIFTFGAIAWLLAVIEAMVAAPLVALGVTHPEGSQAFGKSEGAIMILMNVFLRPSMMVIGFIAGIIMTFVSVWVINAGFANTMIFIQGQPAMDSGQYAAISMQAQHQTTLQQAQNVSSMDTGYSSWAGIYAFFFCIVIYTTMYLTVVQKAFTLIAILPDKVLRWIGGQPENIGQEAAGWAEESKKAVTDAGGATEKGGQQIAQKSTAKAKEKAQALKDASKQDSDKIGEDTGGGGDGGGGAESTQHVPPEAAAE